MTSYPRCVMGCPNYENITIHAFPENPKRREEWCRILGVYPKTKRPYICGAHFKYYYKYGNRLSRFAVPDPTEPKDCDLKEKQVKKSNKLIRRRNASIKKNNSQQNVQENANITTTLPNLGMFNKKHELVLPLSDFQTYKINFLPQQVLHTNAVSELTKYNTNTSSLKDTYNQDSSLQEQTCFSSFDNNKAVTEVDNVIKTGDFEIRHRDTNELIVQLRSVKTENTRVLSFILPQKYALQQLIKSRDAQCNRQYKEIKKLKTTNARLLKQLNIYRLAMFQWRHVKVINRYLNFRLKKYRQRVLRLKKKLKTFKRIMKLWNEFSVEGIS